MTIGNITNTFSRTKENDAKYGFYPTDLGIVEKEMKLINFNGATPQSRIPCCDFTGGEGHQLYRMYEMIKAQNLEPVAYFNEITRERYGTAMERYGKLENFHLCNSDLFRLKCRNKEGRKYNTDTMVLIRNNPPYGTTEIHGESVRMEDMFFMANDRYLVSGGIHILEVPITVFFAEPNFLKKITYRYDNVNIFKFPEKVFEKFKQVVVIGVKKKVCSNDVLSAERLFDEVRTDRLKSLDEVTEPLYCLTDEAVCKAKEVNLYRDGEVNQITLTNGLMNELDDLFRKEKESDLVSRRIEAVQDEVGIIERSIGHRALELASGKFNKVCGDVLIYGYTDKQVNVSVEIEGDQQITTETEIIVSGIEITNKSGDIIRKVS